MRSWLTLLIAISTRDVENGKQKHLTSVYSYICRVNNFCVGFPHTLSGSTIFLHLFICIRDRELNVCHVVSIRKREDTRNETQGMSVCVCRPSQVSVVVRWRIISTCFLGAINLQGKERYSSLLTFFLLYLASCAGYIPRSHCTLVYKSQYLSSWNDLFCQNNTMISPSAD